MNSGKLINRYEVKLYSEEKQIGVEDLKHLEEVEFMIFSSYLGNDFYDK
jgi:hypothetical protein